MHNQQNCFMSKYCEGGQNIVMIHWPRSQNIVRYIDPGVNIKGGKNIVSHLVTWIPHRTPAMAGPSDGWLALGCVWVCCSPYVSMHYCYVNIIIIRNIIIIIIIKRGYLTLNHWTVCWKLVLHWARYECTCCTALTLVVEIIIIYCMPSLR